MNRAAFCDTAHRILAQRYRRFREYCCLILRNTRGFCPKRMDSSRPSENSVHTYESTRRHNAESIIFVVKKVKITWSRYRSGMVQRVGRGIVLFFHDRGTRRGWVVSSTPRPHFSPRERPGTHCTGGWVGPRAGLDGGKISSPPGFDPGPSSP